MEHHGIEASSADGLRQLKDDTQFEEALLAAADRALEGWDIDVSAISLVSHSENIVFRVDSQCGQPFVFRFHRPGYHTLPELHGEFHWTAALNRSGIGAPCAPPLKRRTRLCPFRPA